MGTDEERGKNNDEDDKDDEEEEHDGADIRKAHSDELNT
jgi:hypothetical protein